MKKLGWSAIAVMMLGSSSFAGEIWMSRPDGSLQCEPVDVPAMMKSLRSELARARIRVRELKRVDPSQAKGMRMALCGSPTGGEFRIRVKSSARRAAEGLGFKAD